MEEKVVTNSYGEKGVSYILKVKKIILHAVAVFVALVVLFGSWTIVPAGERGVVLRFGKIDRILEQGLSFKIPIWEKVIDMEVRTQMIEVEASAASKDLQTVTAILAVQFNLDPESVGEIYEKLKMQYRTRVIDPAIQNAIKAATAQFNAEALITRRAEVIAVAENSLKERLAEYDIKVTNVDIVNFDFSDEFNRAIEAKVTQEQEALKQENITKQEEEKKKQSILKAQATAESTRLEAQALLLNNDLIEKIYAEAQLEAAKRWNGVLPTHLYGSAPIPLLNLSQ